MTNHPPLTFYDIAMRPPIEKTCSAPNPWKARLALNFKNAAYKTNWVHLPDIASTRRSLNVPAGRKFADGSDFYTLPILHDAATDTKIGDSFDIAVYLQERYPDSGGDLFPVLKENEKLDFECGAHSMIPLSDITECGKGKKYIEYANFNTHVDAAFTAHVQLMVHGLEFPDETAEQSKAEFCRRAGVNSWEFFGVEGEERVKLKASLKGMLGDLRRLFDRDAGGPFILGHRPSYADFVVGGWLRMMSVCLPGHEWEEVRRWHEGIFGEVWSALDRLTVVH